MKKVKIYFSAISLICAGIIILSSCTKLKDTSYTDIVAKDFEPTADDVTALVGTSYGSWRAVLWAGNVVYWSLQEETSDAFVKACKPEGSFCGDAAVFLNHHTWTTQHPAWSDTWYYTYDGVTNCNRVIYQIESGQIPLDAAAKTKLLSEIKVLRASYYYVLCDLWGNVPILTSFDVPEGFLPSQSTRQEVYDFIVSEITAALPNLVDAKDQTTYGRFNNKGAANALLAKTLLNAEVWSGTPRWTECIAACDAVIASGKYSLEPVQGDCFLAENQNSVETIFSVPFGGILEAGFGIRHRFHLYSFPFEAGTTYNWVQGGWGGLRAIPQFISTFDNEDKRLTDGWQQGPLLTSSGAQIYIGRGDSVGRPFIITNTLPSIYHSEDGDGFCNRKYEVIMGEDPSSMDNDVPLFRYADILMMKAECLMRLGQSGAGALVTQVRMRSFSDPAKATVTDEQLLGPSTYDYGMRDSWPESSTFGTTHETTPIQYGRFLDELGWEFCAEAHRRTDMIRFGIYDTRSWLSHQASNDNHTNIGPIPYDVLNTNSNLHQNPGY